MFVKNFSYISVLITFHNFLRLENLLDTWSTMNDALHANVCMKYPGIHHDQPKAKVLPAMQSSGIVPIYSDDSEILGWDQNVRHLAIVRDPSNLPIGKSHGERPFVLRIFSIKLTCVYEGLLLWIICTKVGCTLRQPANSIHLKMYSCKCIGFEVGFPFCVLLNAW